MEKLRIIEAMASYTTATGSKLTQKELAKEIWQDSSEGSQSANMSALIKGNRMQNYIKIIQIICDKTGVDPNFLFGYSKQ